MIEIVSYRFQLSLIHSGKEIDLIIEWFDERE